VAARTFTAFASDIGPVEVLLGWARLQWWPQFHPKESRTGLIQDAAGSEWPSTKRRLHNETAKDRPRASWMAYMYADIKQADETAAIP